MSGRRRFPFLSDGIVIGRRRRHARRKHAVAGRRFRAGRRRRSGGGAGGTDDFEKGSLADPLTLDVPRRFQAIFVFFNVFPLLLLYFEKGTVQVYFAYFEMCPVQKMDQLPTLENLSDLFPQ